MDTGGFDDSMHVRASIPTIFYASPLQCFLWPGCTLSARFDISFFEFEPRFHVFVPHGRKKVNTLLESESDLDDSGDAANSFTVPQCSPLESRLMWV